MKDSKDLLASTVRDIFSIFTKRKAVCIISWIIIGVQIGIFLDLAFLFQASQFASNLFLTEAFSRARLYTSVSKLFSRFLRGDTENYYVDQVTTVQEFE